MARPQKVGIDYFPIDVFMDQDDKVAMIEAIHGLAGFGFLIRLLMKIYQEGYYYEWTEKEQILFSKRVNVNINEVAEIINDCIKWELFNKELFNKYQILTSKGIQLRYLKATERRNSVEFIKEYLLIPTEDIGNSENIVIVNNNEVNVNNNPINTNIGTQSIEENSKEKDITVYNHSDDYQNIIDLYHEKLSMLPKVIKLSDKRKRLLKARIDEYSLDEIKDAISLVEDSDFLTGRNGKWQASFDWIFNASNFTKILEGNYKNKEQARQPERRMDRKTKFHPKESRVEKYTPDELNKVADRKRKEAEDRRPEKVGDILERIKYI